MNKIYKKYEFSLSLNGNRIMHIARNASGMVIFRAQSEKELIDMIDEFLYQEEQKRAREAKKVSKKSKKKKILNKKNEEETEEVEDVKSVLEPPSPPQTRVTRGPDGKFISKSVLEKKDDKKKGFWQKLTS